MVKTPHAVPFARTVDLELVAAGTVEVTLVSNDDPEGYLFILFSEIDNVDADYIEIAWKDSLGTLYKHKRQTGAGSWQGPGQRDYCDVEQGMDLVAVISDAVGAATGVVKVQGARAR